MNWEDEPYIKEYIRDTVEFKLLPWQAKCIAGLIRRKLDRAGVMEIGKHSPAQAISAMIDVPLEVVEPGLKSLIDNETFVVNGETLLSPNYMEAQEAKQSDKARQALSRQRRRDKAGVTKRDQMSQDVTDLSQNVTNCHTVSHGVTNRIEENSLEESRGLSQDCEDQQFETVTIPPPPQSWKKINPVTDVSVFWCLQELAHFRGELSYHRADLESIARQANQHRRPVTTLERVVRARAKQCEESGKRIVPKWVAKDFDELANQPQPHVDWSKHPRVAEITKLLADLEKQRQVAHHAKDLDKKHEIEGTMTSFMNERKRIKEGDYAETQ